MANRGENRKARCKIFLSRLTLLLESPRVAHHKSNPSQHDPQLSGLGNRILKHWKHARPNQVKHLRATGQLQQRVEDAANQHAKVAQEAFEKGLSADQGDELARQDWITPEPENPKSDQQDLET